MFSSQDGKRPGYGVPDPCHIPWGWDVQDSWNVKQEDPQDQTTCIFHFQSWQLAEAQLGERKAEAAPFLRSRARNPSVSTATASGWLMAAPGDLVWESCT